MSRQDAPFGFLALSVLIASLAMSESQRS